ncbi:4-(cytidine 5'-diphospho)-2-C-methyl-D-erythritol kinase [Mycoplasmatota bacterium]|nr:4-(cytidine 5'-diphospho)-2-C-methyl-D-erythritol kinase [Mycoplasmatota bacterium]
MEVYEKAYAKINLTLNVLGKREDGYHDLLMIMTPISLMDELIIEDSHCDDVSCNIDELNGRNNIVFKTIETIKSSYDIDRSVKVTVNKKIPIGAGLGGGSADCAATLRGLNKLWELNLSLDELADIGLELGADVPFCVYNRQAVVSGIGEQIKFIDGLSSYVVLVNPNEQVSTKRIFESTDLNYIKKHIDQHISLFRENDISSLKKILFNDLQDITLSISSECRKIYEIINDVDDSFLMTGSGSTFFSIYSNYNKANKIAEILSKKGINSIVATIMCNNC